MVTEEDVSEPVKPSDDVTVAAKNELDSCNADNLSSVIGVDRPLVVSSVETSISDNSVTVSDAAINDTVGCSAAEPGVGSQSELFSSSSSELVIDTSSGAGEDFKAESLEAVASDTVAVCETVDETICDPVVSEALPLSSDVPVAFLIPSTEVGKALSGDDAEPSDMQLDVAECVEIGDTAD